MSYADDHPGYRISSLEEARNWVIELTEELKVARAACDFAATVGQQRKAYATWMVKHGGLLGALMALHRTGMLNDVAYNELQAQAMATMTPTIVGAVNG